MSNFTARIKKHYCNLTSHSEYNLMGYLQEPFESTSTIAELYIEEFHGMAPFSNLDPTINV